MVNPVGPEFRGTWKDPLTGRCHDRRLRGPVRDRRRLHSSRPQPAASGRSTMPKATILARRIGSGSRRATSRGCRITPIRPSWHMGWGTDRLGSVVGGRGAGNNQRLDRPTDSVIPGPGADLVVTGANGNSSPTGWIRATGNLTIDDHRDRVGDQSRLHRRGQSARAGAMSIVCKSTPQEDLLLPRGGPQSIGTAASHSSIQPARL